MNIAVKGRVALITGGSQGIGEVVVRMLAAEGAKVAFTFHSERARAGQIVADIEHAGGEALCLPLDLEELATVDAVADAVLARYGTIDIPREQCRQVARPHDVASAKVRGDTSLRMAHGPSARTSRPTYAPHAARRAVRCARAAGAVS